MARVFFLQNVDKIKSPDIFIIMLPIKIFISSKPFLGIINLIVLILSYLFLFTNAIMQQRAPIFER